MNFPAATSSCNSKMSSSVPSKRSAQMWAPVGVAYEPNELVTCVRDGLRIEELASINASDDATV
jgi:hypothetical protein